MSDCVQESPLAMDVSGWLHKVWLSLDACQGLQGTAVCFGALLSVHACSFEFAALHAACMLANVKDMRQVASSGVQTSALDS